MFKRDQLVRPILSTFDGQELPLNTEKTYRVVGYNEETDQIFIVSEECLLRAFPGQLFVTEMEPVQRAIEQLFNVLDNAALGTVAGNNKLTQAYNELRAFLPDDNAHATVRASKAA